MECNKDDAIKAREIAERKFNEKDISGAKKFAVKAQKLFPGLEGISQLIATLDVYLAAENPVLGEADFYRVLGVGPEADDDNIRKQYRKLALMLHPDKNKSIGAEGAFKLISEAWSLLSDKNRKVAYDARRKSHHPPSTNGFYNFAKSTMSNPPKVSKTHRPNGSSSSRSKANQSTFWTVCHRCKMQYEYLRSYLNQNLQCPNCVKPFFAIETPAPISGITSWKASNEEANKYKRSHNDGGFQWTPFSGPSGVSSVAQAANVVQQTYEKVKRVREEQQAAKKKRKHHAFGETIASLSEKKRRVSDAFGVSSTIPPPKPCDSASIYASRINKLNRTRELSHSELRSILMHKARKEILNRITELKSASKISNTSLDKTKGSYDENERQENDALKGDSSKESSKSLYRVTQSNEIIDQLSIPVPDSDFYDFDKDRTEKSFGENQVWALYDNYNGMPRFYAMVRSVISRNPFKLRIGWLNSNGFSKACGDFKVGRHETHNSLNCFSHKVRWTKGRQGGICIFPRKGEVWAMYRNWCREWNEITEDDVIHKYEMVEVVHDYDEEEGVVVIPLVKVAGYKAVFHHHLDTKQVRIIPKEEILRFSHKVPSHLISGREASNALKGCWELDPAALPPEFLQVIADAKQDNWENSQ